MPPRFIAAWRSCVLLVHCSRCLLLGVMANQGWYSSMKHSALRNFPRHCLAGWHCMHCNKTQRNRKESRQRGGELNSSGQAHSPQARQSGWRLLRWRQRAPRRRRQLHQRTVRTDQPDVRRQHAPFRDAGTLCTCRACSCAVVDRRAGRFVGRCRCSRRTDSVRAAST